MHDLLSAIALGVVEGVTEFLPISSTGHLILVNQWFAFEPGFTELFNVVIQLGAILAVVALYWKRLWPAAPGALGIWKKAAVAVVPALAAGFFFGDFVEEALFNPVTVAVALLVGGILLIVSERMGKRESIATVADMSYKTAFAIGLIQCLALVPGTSRSAATIVGALFLGASRVAAAEFSFFLAIPTMAAASGYSLLKGGAGMTGHQALVLAVGFAVSFLVAWAVIKAFMRFIQTRTFAPFGYYRIAAGALVLACVGLGWL